MLNYSVAELRINRVSLNLTYFVYKNYLINEDSHCNLISSENISRIDLSFYIV